MKLVLDVNLSPAWVEVLRSAGYETDHWSDLGPITATDAEIARWSREHGRVILTNDLNFSAILAATGAQAPSVVQIRGQDLAPSALSETLLAMLRQFQDQLTRGAIMSLDTRNARVRLLPLA